MLSPVSLASLDVIVTGQHMECQCPTLFQDKSKEEVGKVDIGKIKSMENRHQATQSAQCVQSSEARKQQYILLENT